MPVRESYPTSSLNRVHSSAGTALRGSNSGSGSISAGGVGRLTARVAATSVSSSATWRMVSSSPSTRRYVVAEWSISTRNLWPPMVKQNASRAQSSGRRGRNEIRPPTPRMPAKP